MVEVDVAAGRVHGWAARANRVVQGVLVEVEACKAHWWA
jgi:hypothetical protein